MKQASQPLVVSKMKIGAVETSGGVTTKKLSTNMTGTTSIVDDNTPQVNSTPVEEIVI